MRPRSLAMLAVLLPLASAPAQLPDRNPHTIAVGDRARATLVGQASVPGRVLTLHGDTLQLVAARGERVLFRMTELERLEVSRGQTTHTGRGAIIGAVAGAALGAAIGSQVQQPTNCSTPGGACRDEFVGIRMLFGAGVGIIPGGLLGAVLGARPRERWVIVEPIRVQGVPQSPR